MRNNGLDYDERMKLVEFKDNCYVNGRLNEERIKAYEEEIERCERLGYNVEVHKLVIGRLYQKNSLQ